MPLEKIAQETLAAARLSGVGTAQPNPEEWMRRFVAWSEGLAHANLPDLPDSAISRESIYAERGL